jgi:hypothetical protein
VASEGGGPRTFLLVRGVSVDNDANWSPKIPTPKDYEIRPPRKFPPWPTGQDFDTLTAKYGRPKGPFEFGRLMVYNGEGRYI